MNVSRTELLAGGGALLLLATALVRLAVPDRSRMRRLSVEGIDIASAPIRGGQTVVSERQWNPPEDVYVVGWNYHVGAPAADPELLLLDGTTALFMGVKGQNTPLNPSFYQGGTGYLLLKGRPLTLRLKVSNTGPDGHTLGARALVYFLPVAGN
jgi:hypothetical protein